MEGTYSVPLSWLQNWCAVINSTGRDHFPKSQTFSQEQTGSEGPRGAGRVGKAITSQDDDCVR